MTQSRSRDSYRREEEILIDRLITRQGETPERATLLVAMHRKGQPAEIDPALMEGLEKL